MSKINWLMLFVLVLITGNAAAQPEQPRIYKIAVFAPLYLDSLFDNYTFKSAADNIPRYAVEGLDFYNGVMLAVDQLKKDGVKNLEVHVYDSRKAQGLEETIRTVETGNFSMIIASIHNAMEQKSLSELSLKQNIPLVSANYPNETAIENNPFFIMLSPPLKTHIQGVAKLLQRYKTENILYVTRQGGVEKMIREEFDRTAKSGKTLKYRTIELSDNFKFGDLSKHMDTAVQNVIVCGSLSDNFAVRLVKAVDTAREYQTIAVGMPTWDDVRAFSKKDIRYTPILYTRSANYDRSNSWSLTVAKMYKDKYLSKPTEQVFAGFESMYRFARLLLKHPTDLTSHISDKSYNVWNAFEFEPAKLDSGDRLPDYLENKKLYLVTKQAGAIKSVQAQ